MTKKEIENIIKECKINNCKYSNKYCLTIIKLIEDNLVEFIDKEFFLNPSCGVYNEA